MNYEGIIQGIDELAAVIRFRGAAGRYTFGRTVAERRAERHQQEIAEAYDKGFVDALDAVRLLLVESHLKEKNQ